MPNQKGIVVPLVLFGVLAVISGIGLIIFFQVYKPQPNTQVNPSQEPTPTPIASSAPKITDFESCVNSGNPIQESYPRRCISEGKIFTESIPVEASPSASPLISEGSPKKCVIGGCSGQLCYDESEGEIISTCEWREEYACYKERKCELQTTGQCGWTDTETYKQCLNQL